MRTWALKGKGKASTPRAGLPGPCQAVHQGSEHASGRGSSLLMAGLMATGGMSLSLGCQSQELHQLCVGTRLAGHVSYLPGQDPGRPAHPRLHHPPGPLLRPLWAPSLTEKGLWNIYQSCPFVSLYPESHSFVLRADSR